MTAQSLANRVKNRAGSGPKGSARVMEKVNGWLDPQARPHPGAHASDPLPAERILADLQDLLGEGLSADVVAPLVATVRRQAADIAQLSESMRDLAEEVVALRRAHHDAHQTPRPIALVAAPQQGVWTRFLNWMAWAAR